MVTELAVEAKLLEQKQINEYEVQKLKIREELAKARVRVFTYNEVWTVNFQEAIMYKERQFDHDRRYFRPDYENTVQRKKKNCFNTRNSNAVRDYCKEKLKQKSVIKENVTAVTVYEDVSKMMCQLLKQQSASDIDIDIFSGNPMDFNCFMAVFNEIVEEKVDDPSKKLTELIKYTTGDAKETVKKLHSVVC